GVVRRMRFLEPVTVTTLSLSRIVPPFGLDGGAPGALGENIAEWPDGTRQALGGNAEVDLPAGGVFEMHTPGGGGWGKDDR
ncbi:MAG: hydantoinase B/oxoprolinase family protein, partial [Maritimibacter sp.]|nr:hydantoinase B/oxoprolinase family protein [Maritimibacter sp.]